ncbi:hypothetical protein K9M50_01335 [Patescibacteria group bacterium]|nr:hypothetical protein [Patescibacteria group bacterium]
MKKHLLSQLHNLKDIEPDKQWKAESQEFLRTHISEGVKSGVFSKVMVWIKDFAKVSSQPAFALSAFVLILITGAFFSNSVLSEAQPNDSLYIARIISEKAQLNMTFNKENRDKLSAQFATNHAKDITNLMNNPEFHEEEGSEDKLANLSEDFNNEINSAKESINNINEREKETYNYNNSEDNINDSSGTNNSELNSDGLNEDGSEADDGVIFSADTKKDDQGLEINVKDNEGVDDNVDTDSNETDSNETDTATSTNEDVVEDDKDLREDSKDINADKNEDSSGDTNIEEENASSTLNELQSITNEVNKEGGDVDETTKALDDAQKLFNEEKYQEALEKLNEVENMLESVSSEINEENSVE